MDVTAEIKKIIDFVKTQKNSIARNKTLSHLYDAQFAANELSSDAQPKEDQKDDCICPAGAYRIDCPTHGSQK